MKKVLLLGGSRQQIPAILKTKELGHYAITCDYLPGNPGHAYADEYHNVSTTDREGVLDLAAELRIDGVVAYASDPAAPTAAYVAELLGLPGSPVASVETLSRKDLFREFLGQQGFNVPVAAVYRDFQEASRELGRFRLPVMVKPVDSSGSKGISKISSGDSLKPAVEKALQYSRLKKFMVEEFIEKKGYQISGDGFSVDGRLVFRSFANEFYARDGIRDYVPLGECWPCFLEADMQQEIHDELQRLITRLGMKTTAYNIEVVLDRSDRVYILELGGRNGGSYIPQMIRYASGVDLVEYTVKAAVGEDCSGLRMQPETGFWSNYMLHSKLAGRLRGIEIEDEFRRKNLVEIHSDAISGDEVAAFEHAGHSLGTLIMKFTSKEEMLRKLEHIERYVKVVVE